ncbi:hypothetical protein BD410DRAFT_714088 [Rickenella mellea]|uniref:Protein OS-9 homolog n=1 Tax=Rickenella mellea TaxID=50990 RepID=A0A4Y7QKJ7_9AGAM|nr:hypothetical protein BD410DRAFT_714088 [Rickenella mellea]
MLTILLVPLLLFLAVVVVDAEDLFAFPKYRVSFLHARPILNDTAHRWLAQGLASPIHFLEHPSFKQIASSDDVSNSQVQLELMRISPTKSYLCLIPPPLEDNAPKDDDRPEATPAQTWNLLQPLADHCLYHRQGWFTYSYCHNHQVRQFREAPHAHPHPPGGYTPEEDLQYEAYTLGRAPAVPAEGQELSLAQQAELSKTVELARGQGHRYLVQKWSDGTMCDKTGKPREIEVQVCFPGSISIIHVFKIFWQFHCSLIMSDTVLLVKETKTCTYVMVVHTPRLCAEPGFKPRLEQREEALIQCREVVDSLENADPSLPDSAHPYPPRIRNPILGPPPPPPPLTADERQGDDGTGTSAPADASEIIRRAVEALLTGGGTHQGDGARVKVEKGNQEGEVLIEFLDDDTDIEEMESRVDNLMAGAGERLQDALRAFGVDVSGRAEQKDKKEGKDKRKREAVDRNNVNPHQEL